MHRENLNWIALQGLDKYKEIAENLTRKVAFKNEMPKSVIDDEWMKESMMTAISDWKDKPVDIAILEPDWNAEQTITGKYTLQVY